MPRPDLETNVRAEVVTLTATEWVRSLLGRSSVCVCVAEKGANPRDDRLKSSRAPCGLEMIGITDSHVTSNRTFHWVLLLRSGLAESRAFFANKQVVSMRIPGLCHPFLLLKEKKILQGLK